MDVDAFGHDFGSFGTEVRNTSTLHWSGVSTVFTDGDHFDTGFENVYNHIEVNVGLVITPTGIKDIIDFDGVGLGNLLKIIFGGDNHVVAVGIVMAVDVALTIDLVDGEG